MNELRAGNTYKAAEVQNAVELYRQLKIFPTPFKGIYYAPYESERNGWYVTDPNAVVFAAARLYIGNDNYYFGLYSALYSLRVIWNPFGFDIINPKKSRKLRRKQPSGNYWRAKAIRKIMKNYPYPIRIHRIKNFSMKGTERKGSVIFSSMEKTKADAEYLCKKGDDIACEVLQLIKKQRMHR